MSAPGLYTMILNVANIINELDAAGLRLEIGCDFAAYRRLRNAQAERSPLYPMFDAACSYVDASNAFWVCGFNSTNELVHTQAIRLLDMTGVPLGEHLEVHRHKYITPNSTPDPDRTFFLQAPALKHITGRVCYHGEFWLKGGEAGLRDQGFTALLSRIVFELALRTWSPDYVFGLVPMPLAFKGIPVRYGYAHCEPGTWSLGDGRVTSEEALVWMSRGDIIQFLETAPKALSQERRLPNRRELDNRICVVA